MNSLVIGAGMTAGGSAVTMITIRVKAALLSLRQSRRESHQGSRGWKLGQRLAGVSAWRITDLAASLAGRKRPALREEWREHLTGLPAQRKVGAALGFVVASVRCRLRDAADFAWIPADAVLKSRALSNLVVGVPTVMAAAMLFRHDGIDGVIVSWESIAAISGSLYALIRLGRWWRGVKPLDPKPRGRADVKQSARIRAGGRCSLCGSTASLEYDYIVPLAIGGTVSAENLRVFCANCHRRMAAG